MYILYNRSNKGNLEVYKRALENLEELKIILNDLNYNDTSIFSTGLYKFLTISFKVFHLQRFTKRILEVLKLIAGEQINPLYLELVEVALNKRFIFAGKMVDYSNAELKVECISSEIQDTNDNWLGITGPIVLAYMISEAVIRKLINICESDTDMDEDKLNELAYTELSVIFRTI